MGGEVHGFETFYASPGGAMAARLLAQRLRALWPSLRGQAVLGVGHAVPYLPLWKAEAARAIALSPAQPGPDAPRPDAAILVAGEEALPFPDLCFDRVLLVHGLEMAENARRLLREVWRVLKDDGRLLVVAPNRRGLWAHAEHTPFGHGQPFSRRQLLALLKEARFSVTWSSEALMLAPLQSPSILKAASAMETVGKRAFGRFGGVMIVEAMKQVYAFSSGKRVRRLVPRLRPVLLPSPQPLGRVPGTSSEF